MKFQDFISNLTPIKNASLGGLKAHEGMVPIERAQFSEDKIKLRNPKEASVLALFYPDNNDQTRFLLTLRANYKGTHSSQISFPGGKKDITDLDAKHTAFRETQEEVGLDKGDIQFIKELTQTYIPPSNFLVTPFIGIAKKTPIFKTNEEVEAIIEVKLSDLLDDENVIIKNMSASYMENIDIPCFKLNDYIVWGATAMILNEIKYVFNSL